MISVFGSSLTFYKGRKFNEELVQKVTNLTGCAATTQSNGLVEGLKVAGAKRVALATAYTDIVTARLKIFLEEYGFEVTSAKGLGFVQIPEGAATGPDPAQAGHGSVREFKTRGRAGHVVRCAANARPHRSAGERDQGPRRVVDASWIDERRPPAGCQPESAGLRHGAGESVIACNSHNQSAQHPIRKSHPAGSAQDAPAIRRKTPATDFPMRS